MRAGIGLSCGTIVRCLGRRIRLWGVRVEALPTAAALIVRSMVLSARYVGYQRLLWLRETAGIGGDIGELARLRDENRRLKSENRQLKSRLHKMPRKRRYSPMQRLQILWHMAYYGIPRSRVKDHFLIAKSTPYRWLHAAESGDVGDRKSPPGGRPKTPQEVVRMIWDMFDSNPHFGRNRIAMTLWLLGVFVAASTVRNILLRPKARKAPAGATQARAGPEKLREIVARYANHVWSVDRTRVYLWGLWPTWVLVAIDHFSRMVTAVCPLEGPNAGWVIDAVESAFRRHGHPRHLITDQEGVFVSDAFRGLLGRWDVRQRFEAVGQHGSVAVTERVILTLKYEWLRRVPVIRSFGHLTGLLRDFEVYHSDCRGHMTLGGARPAVIHRGESPLRRRQSDLALYRTGRVVAVSSRHYWRPERFSLAGRHPRLSRFSLSQANVTWTRYAGLQFHDAAVVCDCRRLLQIQSPSLTRPSGTYQHRLGDEGYRRRKLIHSHSPQEWARRPKAPPKMPG